MTSAVNPVGSWSTTVRQMPLTAMESPGWMSVVTVAAVMWSLQESPRGVMVVMVPISSMIPLNMRLWWG